MLTAADHSKLLLELLKVLNPLPVNITLVKGHLIYHFTGLFVNEARLSFK